MSGIKISELTSANSVTKSTIFPIVEGGNTYKVAMETLLNYFYPVGTIYESTSLSTVAAIQNKFGGTWEVFGSGRVLVGVDTADTDFDTVNKTGGEKSHKLTASELPEHSHTLSVFSTTKDSSLMGSGSVAAWAMDSQESKTTSKVGSNTAHNNVQPYVTIYRYRRIA